MRQRWQQVQQLLQQAQVSFEIAWTEHAGHATVLAQQAASQGVRKVACVGGDGTTNEVVNGLMQVGDLADADQRPTLALIPVGTGTDFARSLHLPRHLAGAVEIAVHGVPGAVDVGHVTCQSASGPVNRYFVNVAGFGFDAEAADLLARQGKRSGRFSYARSVFQVLRRYVNKSLHIRLGTAQHEQQITGTFYMVIAANARYFGNGMLVAPHADLSDGLLDVILVGAMSPLAFLRQFPNIYRGTHLAHPAVQSIRAQWLEVQATDAATVLLEGEGEVFGQAPARITLLPKALNVIQPGPTQR